MCFTPPSSLYSAVDYAQIERESRFVREGSPFTCAPIWVIRGAELERQVNRTGRLREWRNVR
jgi:hypothetical protein